MGGKYIQVMLFQANDYLSLMWHWLYSDELTVFQRNPFPLGSALMIKKRKKFFVLNLNYLPGTFYLLVLTPPSEGSQSISSFLFFLLLYDSLTFEDNFLISKLNDLTSFLISPHHSYQVITCLCLHTSSDRELFPPLVFPFHFGMALVSVISRILVLFNTWSETQLNACEVKYGNRDAYLWLLALNVYPSTAKSCIYSTELTNLVFKN